MPWEVPKENVRVTITLTNSSTIKGEMFLNRGEIPKSNLNELLEELNTDSLFFPFLVLGDEEIMLINKKQLMYVHMEPEEEQEEDLADIKKSLVRIDIKNGNNIKGTVEINFPKGKRRVQDFLNLTDRFFALRGDDWDYIVNKNHVLNVTDLGES